MTGDTLFFFKQKVPEKSQKEPKNALKMLKRAQKCRKVFKKRRDFRIFVLLSAHAERVGDSSMRDFLNTILIYSNQGGVAQADV